jgi:hypothetical protein
MSSDCMLALSKGFVMYGSKIDDLPYIFVS